MRKVILPLLCLIMALPLSAASDDSLNTRQTKFLREYISKEENSILRPRTTNPNYGLTTVSLLMPR